MRHICILVSLASLIILQIPENIPVNAESIKDCYEEGADCPELDKDSGVHQDQTDSEAATPSEAPGSMIWKLIQMGFALILILGLIYGLLYLLSKRGKMFSGVKTLENMGGISVGQNKSLQIVRIGKQFYVIGVGDNVEILREITDDDVTTELMQTRDAAPQNQMTQIMSRVKKQSDQQHAHSFKSLYAKELANMKHYRQKLVDTKKGEHHE